MDSFFKLGNTAVWQYDPVTQHGHWLNNSGSIQTTVKDGKLCETDLIVPEDMERLKSVLQTVIETKAIRSSTARVRTANESHDYYILFLPVMEGEVVSKVLFIFSAMGSVWSSLVAQGPGEHVFEKILQTIPIDLVIFDTDYRFLFISEVAIANKELRENLIGKTEFDYCRIRNKSYDIVAKRFEKYKEAITHKTNVVYEEVLQKDGKDAHKLRVFHPVLGTEGQILFVIGYGYDVTKIRESETIISRQQIAIEAATDGIGLLDAEGKYIYLNKAHCELFGYLDAEELIGKTWKELYASEEIQRIETELMPEMAREGRWSGETVGRSKDGEIVHQEITLTPLPGGGLICICRDTAKRRKQEEEMRNLALVVENTKSIVIITDRHKKIEWVNQAFVDLTGYTLEEAKGKNPGGLLQGKDSCPATRAYLKNTIDAGAPFNCEILNYNKWGQAYWVNIHGQPMRDERGEIVRYFSIQEDITYRKEIERDLIIAKEAAEASATAKRRFLANMSHEIRTPMNAVIGFTDLIMKTELSEEQANYVQTIQSAANNLLTVINDILDISKIEEGKVSLEKIDMNLADVVRRAIDVLTPKAEEKGIALRSRLDELDGVNLIGDPYRLNQVLLNIVGNAVKFTEQGTVSLNCSCEKRDESKIIVRFEVTDTGIGMDEDMLANLFNAFHQADQSFVRKYGGTGLGLSISKSLVELMGGSIEVYSKPELGTKVSIHIPFQYNEHSGARIEQRKEIDAGKIVNKKVLLVEDNQMNSIVATLMLRNAGVIVDLAINGRDAFDRLQQDSYDLVLMDIQMPVMDGVDATRLIRQEGNAAVPIIALTAHALREEKDIYLGVGMNDFLTKPFKEAELLQILDKWLN